MFRTQIPQSLPHPIFAQIKSHDAVFARNSKPPVCVIFLFVCVLGGGVLNVSPIKNVYLKIMHA